MIQQIASIVKLFRNNHIHVSEVASSYEIDKSTAHQKLKDLEKDNILNEVISGYFIVHDDVETTEELREAYYGKFTFDK